MQMNAATQGMNPFAAAAMGMNPGQYPFWDPAWVANNGWGPPGMDSAFFVPPGNIVWNINRVWTQLFLDPGLSV
jgi:hypothetical protein